MIDIILNIFSFIGYFSTGLVTIVTLSDKNKLVECYFQDGYLFSNGYKKTSVMLRTITILLWPIVIPLLLIALGINYILLKRYKKKYKEVGQLKKIMVRKNDIIYNFYCEHYNI